MSTLNIQLPPKVKAAAESRAAEGHCTVDAYLESLIIADATDDFGAPEHLNVGSQAMLGTIRRGVYYANTDVDPPIGQI